MTDQPLDDDTQTALNHYSKPEVRAHYESLTLYGHNRLEAALAKLNGEKSPENDGLQAKVSSRTKDFQSLCENILSRKQTFKKWEKIRDKYNDLAGVRLILYMPGKRSRKKAEELIKEIWPKARTSRNFMKKTEKEVEKSNNEEPDDSNGIQDDRREDNESCEYKATHVGYQAVHFVIKADLRDIKEFSNDKFKYTHKAGDQFEIQVVSAFLNGWAEAQHDVQYKSMAYGKPSEAEQRILDAINGIMLSGDLLLEQYYQIFYSRVYQRFNAAFELGRFLRDSDISQHHDLFPVQCHTYLVELLRKHDKNFPMAARECIKQLGAPDKTSLDISITDSISGTWIGFICLAQRLEASCSTDLNYDGYDDFIKQGVAIITTILLLEDLTHTNDFLGKILFCNTDLSSQPEDVFWSLMGILLHAGVLWESHPRAEDRDGSFELSNRLLKNSKSLAWQWFKLKAENTNCFRGLVFRLVIRKVVPAVAPGIGVMRAKRLYEEASQFYYGVDH